ncbi:MULTISPECIES: sigma-E factor regulatory protein RseB [Aliivibrio]|jgi:sigma-E factor negative regulatory protein RseB|uniref:Sigma-E factor regulatory protein RseB n=2 Tax=Aliivibrio TaxID=511678 RepID=B6EKN3_ALISL|nr:MULTISPECIES: sigma-E factor regulatory protein RseB [Aliivibrio]AZL85653.1 sigma-E factor regulatory protein RseB [Aliivibrio salmonicida]MBB1312892.1 sigma-E factor regulatory protein RseB [Aliivibrio sp. SR45-2]OEF20126.1 sigma-E factor regulatory protein RseB [Aliivibrio logei 5S-186]CAQ80213.1 sigma-E factor regulatory protein RseB precursor [Aliivibrio salmonicida LFI1238]
MKRILISLIALVSIFPIMASAEDKPSAEALLHQMDEASHSLNYELSYILVKKNSIEPFMYRHSHTKDMTLSHLVYLSGSMREVIRRNDEISYLEQGSKPFSIQSEAIVAPIIPLLHKNVAELNQYYDFISMGRAREAGSPTQVIRIVSKDGARYSYVVWIDERSKLPLRTDLVSRDGDIIEQYRVVSYTVNDQITEFMKKRLGTVELPKVLKIPAATNEAAMWSVNWIPQGFKKINFNRYRLSMNQRSVESKMFSDGLFNFSVYISEADKLSHKEQLVTQGRRSLHSYIKGEYEISVVGDIPTVTAKRIANSVVFDSSDVNVKEK